MGRLYFNLIAEITFTEYPGDAGFSCCRLVYHKISGWSWPRRA